MPAAATTSLAVLISGGGTNLQALLAATANPAYGARVVAVFADRPNAGGLVHARAADVPTVVVAPGDFPDRAAWDKGLAEAIAEHSPGLVVSAGFMRLLGPAVLGRFPGRIVNTHPALLPAFPGAHGVRDALAYGVKVAGVTVHLVDEGVDTGPVLAQAVVAVHEGDDVEALHERIKAVERPLLVEVVGRMARDGWSVHGRKVTIP